MRRASRLLLIVLGVFQVIALVFASEKRAYAYADPGSGLLLIQIVSTTVASALFILRARLRKLFRMDKHKASDAPDIQP
jgi:hypothetical protein